jgi:hypothetical protein
MTEPTASARPVLADFDISKDLEQRAAQTLTESGTIVGGTFMYRAPEILPRIAPFNGKGERQTERSDMYAFGVVSLLVFSAKCRACVGDGTEIDFGSGMGSLLDDDTPDTVEPLVQALLAPDPAQRPSALQAALDPALRIHAVVHQLASQTQAAEVKAAAREAELADARTAARAAAVARQSAEDARLRALQRDCAICLDSFPLHEGVECGAEHDRHYVCNGCFDGHVRTEAATEDLDMLAERHGNVFCPYQKHGCTETAAYGDAVVARHVTAATFATYTAGKKKLLEIQLVREIGEAERARFEAELHRIRNMDEEQRQVHQHGIALEDAVNLKCPRCAAVFLDFGGCCALTCSRAGCGAAFCAWCQQDCGGDAHQHVGQCPERPRGAHPAVDPLFPAAGVWERSQRARANDKVKGYLQAIPDAALRNQVALSRIGLLVELGIDVGDYVQDDE